jgi:plasmid stabilization system protein ParE
LTLPVVWLDEAISEYYEALQWYIGISPRLGGRFAEAVERVVLDIAETPLRFPVIQKSRRRAGVRLFPYGIFFLVEDSRIVVIACFHGKRNPRRWQQR